MDVKALEDLWSFLKEEASKSSQPLTRVYRALGKTAIGIRASYIIDQDTIELLAEIPAGWQSDRPLPDWHGLQLEVLTGVIGSGDTHVSISLTDKDSLDIFLYFASDIVISLEDVIDPDLRVFLVVECLDRWALFFEKSGLKGLTPAAQRGLFAELIWIEKTLVFGIGSMECIESWKGCQRAFHDFDYRGKVVEVKSTISKEPRRVTISNERQLDDSGLTSLQLFVLTLQKAGNGRSLPGIINSLKECLQSEPASRAQLDRSLVNAGYFDRHATRYPTRYITKFEEVFNVEEGFPRITCLPKHIGNLRYSIMIDGCHEFENSINDVLRQIRES